MCWYCCCCRSSQETEDVTLLRSTFKSIDSPLTDLNHNESMNSKHEFELKLEKYNKCCGCPPNKQLKYYTIYNIFMWCFICGFILYAGIESTIMLKQSKYTKHCCGCYDYAMFNPNNSMKIDFAYCMDTICNCEFCAPTPAPTPAQTPAQTPAPTPVPMNACHGDKPMQWNKNDCKKKEREKLSVSSFFIFPKHYWGYGLYFFLYGFMYIVFMVISLKCNDVLRFMGISMLVYNLILSLTAWWTVFKIFQYYEYDADSSTCFRDGVNEIEEDVLTVIVLSTMVVVLMQIIVALCRCCGCCGPNVEGTWHWIIRKSEILSLFFTLLATIAFFGDLLYVTAALIRNRCKYMKDQNGMLFWKELIQIIIIDIIIFIKSFDIFLIPLFKQELFYPGITLCLNYCCRVRNENNGDVVSYAKLPTNHSNDDNVN